MYWSLFHHCLFENVDSVLFLLQMNTVPKYYFSVSLISNNICIGIGPEKKAISVDPELTCHVSLFPDKQTWSGTSTKMSMDNIWPRTSFQRRWQGSFRITTPSGPWCCPSMAPLGRERRWSAPCWEIICTAQRWAARTSTNLFPRCTSLILTRSMSTG